MSIARHHTEWLSLVPVSGPFLSLPVLMDAFGSGLEPHEPEHVRLLRQSYADWQESLEKHRGDPAPQQRWVRFVLNQSLEYDDTVLLEGPAIPPTLQVEMPEHHELLRPTFVLKDSDSGKPRLLIQVYPRSQDLSSYLIGSRWKASPDTRMTELLHATGVRLGLVTNGEQWMLVNAPKGETTGYASWYSGLWLEEPITFRAFRSLLRLGRFNAEEDKTLEALLTKSASNQQEVTDQLGYQVRKAVEVLIHSLDRADQDFGRSLLADVPEEVLYESALTVMMRLVFLFCAEERELIPSKPFPVYEQNYSVSTISKQLRELAEQHGEELLERRYDAWPRLLAAYRAVFGGLKHDDVHIPAYGGSLFNPDRFPFLEGRKQKTKWQETEAAPLPVNNRTVLHLLEALQLLQFKVPGGKQAEPRRLSFRAMDIEQIGHVYEGLLDHTAKRATEPYLGLAGSKDKEPEIPLAELENQTATGQKLLEFLEEETGKSQKALAKLLEEELDARDVARLRSACQNDDQLLDRVKAFAGLVRDDTFGYPVIFPKGSVFVTAGTDRRSSGTHYTPRSLTEPIVQYALEPLVYAGPAEGLSRGQWKLKPAKELLALKICDMACGSGAFLVQVCRYLAARLLEAWDAAKQADSKAVHITPEGEASTGRLGETLIPDDPTERYTYALRIVAQRCIYGVDKNPLAVEMTKLSLWLLTLAKDKPFEFLDHSIRCGDSLVGIHSLDQLRHFSLKPDSQDPVLFKGPLDELVDEAVALRQKLEEMSANTVEDVKRQEDLLAEAKQKMAWLRCAADMLVAAEFWGQTANDKQERVRHALAVTEKHLAAGTLVAFEKEAETERRGQVMFHWPLEFPEVIVKHGGFDGFVGNPPFSGGTVASTTLSVPYMKLIRLLYEHWHGKADLVGAFIRRAGDLSSRNAVMGFLATAALIRGETAESTLLPLVQQGCILFRARSPFSWPGAASVTAVCVWLSNSGPSMPCFINDIPVVGIGPDLEEVTSENSGHIPKVLASAPFAALGVKLSGLNPVYDKPKVYSLSPEIQSMFVPIIGGDELYGLSDLMSAPLAVAPERASVGLLERLEASTATSVTIEDIRHAAPAKELIERASKLPLLFACGETTHTQLAFRRVDITSFLLKHKAVGFPSKAWWLFSVLQSELHGAWAWKYGLRRKEDLCYSPKRCAATFPIPHAASIAPWAAGLNDIGSSYHDKREQAMADRAIGLTRFYNRFHDPNETAADIQKLRDLHVEMDKAVAAAYGWDDLDLGHGFHETKQGVRFTISEAARREVLQRLLKLNHERYAEEVKQGLHDKKSKKSTLKPIVKAAPSLFQDQEDDS